MRPISYNQIMSLRTAKQHFCDCYLVASLNALSRSENGRKILQKNILTDGDAYVIKFNNVYGQRVSYLVKQEECDNLILMDKYCNYIPIDIPHNPVVKAVEVAMAKLLKNNPYKKPFICQMVKCNEVFEYNKPSKFLYMFTGVRPLTINENGFCMNLKKYINPVKEVFDRISGSDNSSFVAGTGYTFTGDLMNTHCYAMNKSAECHLNVESDSFIDKNISMYDARNQVNITKSYEELFRRLKFICGYFNEMLE